MVVRIPFPECQEHAAAARLCVEDVVVTHLQHGMREVIGAKTLGHHPEHDMREEDFKFAIRTALEANTDFFSSPERAEYVLQGLTFTQERAYLPSPPSPLLMLLPALFGEPSPVTPTGVPRTTHAPHPCMYTNIVPMVRHYYVPPSVADECARIAQNYMGHFWGRPVRSGQMQVVSTYERGSVTRDTSVEFDGDSWTPPFVIADNCRFCNRMTDDDVTRRVRALQYDIWYETRDNMPTALPSWDLMLRNPEVFDEYRQLRRAADEHTRGLKTPDLDSLPHSLKLSMCIEWNHVWRDWYESEKGRGYSERDGVWYMLTTLTEDAEAPPLAVYEEPPPQEVFNTDDGGTFAPVMGQRRQNDGLTPPSWSLMVPTGEDGQPNFSAAVLELFDAERRSLGRMTMDIVSWVMADIHGGAVGLAYTEGAVFFYDNESGVFYDATDDDACEDPECEFCAEEEREWGDTDAVTS